MFIGLLADVAKHKTVLPAAIVIALEYLQQEDLVNKAPGRYEIDGDKLFYMIDEPMPRMLDGCKAESHQTYTDIQLPISARERFGFALPQADLPIAENFFDTRDIAFYSTPANEFFMDVDPGSFVVFYPGELHRPCVVIDQQKPFRKVVVKVHASLLGL